jgi:hypothetical protein
MNKEINKKAKTALLAVTMVLILCIASFAMAANEKTFIDDSTLFNLRTASAIDQGQLFEVTREYIGCSEKIISPLGIVNYSKLEEIMEEAQEPQFLTNGCTGGRICTKWGCCTVWKCTLAGDTCDNITKTCKMICTIHARGCTKQENCDTCYWDECTVNRQCTIEYYCNTADWYCYQGEVEGYDQMIAEEAWC